jgi:hypothetical protein
MNKGKNGISMAKKGYILIGAALILALLLIGAVAYNSGLFSGSTTTSPSPSIPAITGLMNSTSSITAFQALAVAENNASIKAWKSGKSNVVFSGISSQFCVDGSANTWTIAYDSDVEQIAVNVNGDGAVIGSTVKRTQDMAPSVQISTAGLIDSSNASEAAKELIYNNGFDVNGPSTMKLISGGTGAYIWDISNPVSDGYFIVRVDAASGKVTQNQHIQN